MLIAKEHVRQRAVQQLVPVMSVSRRQLAALLDPDHGRQA